MAAIPISMRMFQQQAVELDHGKRAEILNKMQQILYERVIGTHLWQLAFINGVGPRVGELSFGRIAGFPYTAPYEDLTLKSTSGTERDRRSTTRRRDVLALAALGMAASAVHRRGRPRLPVSLPLACTSRWHRPGSIRRRPPESSRRSWCCTHCTMRWRNRCRRATLRRRWQNPGRRPRTVSATSSSCARVRRSTTAIRSPPTT